MSLSVTLPNDLEQFLKVHAKRVGVPVETLLTRTIVERWDNLRHSSALPGHETALLARLQSLFPPAEAREYRTLCEQSDNGALTEQDRVRLFELIELRDNQNAERLEIVGELATLRNLSVRETLAELEIRAD